MAAFRMLLALTISCVCFLQLVLCFNLEPRIPIVKKGSPKSHFGFSVAQHITITDTISGTPFKESWILVGAPKDQNLQPGTYRSGALWKCPLTTNTTDCTQVRTDGFKNPETGLYKHSVDGSLTPPAEDEIKDDQWMGVTVKSQGPGGKVLVCAHRYMNKGPEFQWGWGLCYILTQYLDFKNQLEPCRGKAVFKGHEQFGFCQAGTSGLILEDEVVLGVPGPYTWRGTVHTSNISDNFLFRDKTQYFGPVTEKTSPVDKYSYLGYSVTAGNFYGDYISYVGGAPRANGNGQVVFFAREKIGDSLLRVDVILDGEKFASSFGFEVLAVDIDADGLDDLVVSAPFYFDKNSSGAIYIYMNNGEFTSDHPYTKITGAPGESRFGFSMTSLGDLNRDGFNDIAVGAPYEGNGVIYIYLGSKDGLITKPSQVIKAEDMPGLAYNAFGYALSGGMDLDNNGYSDLLTSSFCSDRVLLIRARPIIDIQTTVRPEENLLDVDTSRPGCTEDENSRETCFSFDACFKMDSESGAQTGLKLKYKIQAETFATTNAISRVYFATVNKDEKPHVVQRDIRLRPDLMGKYQCSREIVYIKEGTKDILTPVKFEMSYEIIQKEPRPVPEGSRLPDINDYPILNQQEALRYFEATFAKDCGEDGICISDLAVMADLNLEKHESEDHYMLELGQRDDVVLGIEVTNTGEPAYEAAMYIEHHPALAFNPRNSETGIYQCTPVSNSTLRCVFNNPLVNTTGPMVLVFKPSGLPFDKRFIKFVIFANSTSKEATPDKPIIYKIEVIKRAEISIVGSVEEEQVFYGGEVRGESAIEYIDQIGSKVTHKYVVDNRGPWRVDTLEVEVLWPHQVENNKEQGKWLLYMTQPPTVDGDGFCEIDSKYVNPLVYHRQPRPKAEGFDGDQLPEVKGEVSLPGPPDDTERGLEGSHTVVIKGEKTTNITTSITSTRNVTSSETSTERTVSGSSVSSSGITKTEKEYKHTESSSSTHTANGNLEEGTEGVPEDETEVGAVDEEGESGGRRVAGRTHTRVSRRVFSKKTKKVDDGKSVNVVSEAEEDQEVYEEVDGNKTHHREHTRVRPDGTVVKTIYAGNGTVKEVYEDGTHLESEDDLDTEGSGAGFSGGRWGKTGGHRQTHTTTTHTVSTYNQSEGADRTGDGRVTYEGRRVYGDRDEYVRQGGGRGRFSWEDARRDGDRYPPRDRYGSRDRYPGDRYGGRYPEGDTYGERRQYETESEYEERMRYGGGIRYDGAGSGHGIDARHEDGYRYDGGSGYGAGGRYDDRVRYEGGGRYEGDYRGGVRHEGRVRYGDGAYRGPEGRLEGGGRYGGGGRYEGEIGYRAGGRYEGGRRYEEEVGYGGGGRYEGRGRYEGGSRYEGRGRPEVGGRFEGGSGYGAGQGGEDGGGYGWERRYENRRTYEHRNRDGGRWVYTGGRDGGAYDGEHKDVGGRDGWSSSSSSRREYSSGHRTYTDGDRVMVEGETNEEVTRDRDGKRVYHHRKHTSTGSDGKTTVSSESYGPDGTNHTRIHHDSTRDRGTVEGSWREEGRAGGYSTDGDGAGGVDGWSSSSSSHREYSSSSQKTSTHGGETITEGETNEEVTHEKDGRRVYHHRKHSITGPDGRTIISSESYGPAGSSNYSRRIHTEDTPVQGTGEGAWREGHHTYTQTHDGSLVGSGDGDRWSARQDGWSSSSSSHRKYSSSRKTYTDGDVTLTEGEEGEEVTRDNDGKRVYHHRKHTTTKTGPDGKTIVSTKSFTPEGSGHSRYVDYESTQDGEIAGDRVAWNEDHSHTHTYSRGGFEGSGDGGEWSGGQTYMRAEVDPITGESHVYKWHEGSSRGNLRNYPGEGERRWTRKYERHWSSSGSDQDEVGQVHQRTKREKELIIRPEAITDAQTGKTMQVVNLRCDGNTPTAKCFAFRCTLKNLGRNQAASIRIMSRLWNATLVEDYPRVSHVSIKSHASLILPEDIRNDQDQSDDQDSAETLAYPDRLDQLPPSTVPLWVILVSIFAGLLVLIILVLILWKLGFFERKRPDPTLSGNLDKDANGF